MTRHIGPGWGLAKHTPEIRDWLLATWADGGPFQVASNLYRRALGMDIGDRSEAEWSRQTLRAAQLFYLTADAVDQLIGVYESWPADGAVTEADAPSECGLVVLEKPIYGIDSRAEDQEVRVDAILWGPVTLRGPGEERVGIASYCAVPLPDGDDVAWEQTRGLVRLYVNDMEADRSDLDGVFISHLGRSDWLWGNLPTTSPR